MSSTFKEKLRQRLERIERIAARSKISSKLKEVYRHFDDKGYFLGNHIDPFTDPDWRLKYRIKDDIETYALFENVETKKRVGVLMDIDEQELVKRGGDLAFL